MSQSSLGLSTEELKAVEQTRQRLSQLSSSINSLKNEVFTTSPLPTLDSLQSSTDILEHNISAILDIMAHNNALFNRVAIHPSTNFPGRTQENIISQLLRKKPEPDVEASMDLGRTTLRALKRGAGANNTGRQEQDVAGDLERVWELTREACQDGVVEYVNNDADPYTAAEREMGIENVRTGLRRNLEEDDDEDDEDEDEEEGDDVMIIDRPPPPPTAGSAPPAAAVGHETHGATVENSLRFAARGHFVA